MKIQGKNQILTFLFEILLNSKEENSYVEAGITLITTLGDVYYEFVEKTNNFSFENYAKRSLFLLKSNRGEAIHLATFSFKKII